MTLHEIPMERRTLHGHFSRDIEPVVTIDSGDSMVFSTLDAGWFVAPGERFSPYDETLDAGHALVGPVEVRGARAGDALEVRVEEVVPGSWGWTWGDDRAYGWTLEGEVGRHESGHEVDLRPFLGVLGMPPPDSGVHSTGPPRVWGGNIDCKELVAGTTLFLPVPVDGALFSAGDCHARQGDGEVSGTAIECGLERGRLTLVTRDDLRLDAPVARVPDAWLAFGFDEDLDKAVAAALEGMLALMGREHGLQRGEALALASVVVDVRITQIVNGVRGAHAVLADNALR